MFRVKDISALPLTPFFESCAQEGDVHQVPNTLHLSDSPVVPSEIGQLAKGVYSAN